VTTTPRTRRPTDAEVQETWERWRATGEVRHRNQLVMMFTGLVRYLVLKKAKELPHRCEIDDLVSCGLIALMECIERWDPSKGASLEQLAWTRVQGAVIDELRRQDWAPRSVRRAERTVGAAEDRFAALHGRQPSPAELAAALGMSEDQVLAVRGSVDRAVVGSLQAPADGTAEGADSGMAERLDTLVADPETRPDVAVERSEAHTRLGAALAELSPRERRLADLLYKNDLNQREASTVLGVTESRVSQIHSRMRRSLALSLSDHREAYEALV
jgi:RNA polymerase sigma factor for flagellar operon FliA